MTATETFEANRRRLFAVAYRMLGSVADAEEVVQEAWLRWDRADADTIDNPSGWLTTVTTRLAIDRLRSATHRREVYVGPWLPEPVVERSGAPDPAGHAELAESLSMAFLTILERLNPVERAAFLLREVFGAGYDDIATAVDRSEAACRQIVHRARERVDPDRPARYDADPADERRLLDGFLAATFDGDLDALRLVLHDDVVAWSDGGAERRAARHPILGAERVARFMTGIARNGPEDGADLGIESVRVNGDPGFLVTIEDDVFMTMAFELTAAQDGAVRIAAIRAVLNPRKLDHLR